jgi:hypothetical protein
MRSCSKTGSRLPCVTNPADSPGPVSGATRNASTNGLGRKCIAQGIVLALCNGIAQAATYSAATEADLVQALANANAGAGPDTIEIGSDIELSAALPLITDPLTLKGVGGQRAITRNDTGSNACGPTATNAFRLLDATADLSLQDLALHGGCNLVDQGGAVRVQDAALRLERSVVSGNQTFVDDPAPCPSATYAPYGCGGIGAGVAVLYGNLSVIDSTLSGNAAHGYLAVGGGAAVFTGDLHVAHSTISGNQTNGTGPWGAGIYALGGDVDGVPRKVTIMDSEFSGNAASGEYAYGGGLWTYAAGVALSNSRFVGNSVGSASDGRGAGINIQNPHDKSATVISIDRCTISGNTVSTSSGFGAGLRIGSGVISLTSSSVVNNVIDSGYFAHGAGMFIEHADMTIVDTTISDNQARGVLQVGGGGIGILSEAPETMSLAVYNSTIAGNHAVDGTAGGLLILAENAASIPPTVHLESTILAANDGGNGVDAMAAPNTAPSVVARHSLVQGTVAIGAGSFTPDATTTALAGLEPKLLPLANNGGSTPTLALDCGSPAINAGSNVPGLKWDQRGQGFPRKTGRNVDIGAVETNCQTGASPTPAPPPANEAD